MSPENEEVGRELRQLGLMADRLSRFESGDLSIGSVINDLEALLCELQLIDGEWRDDFRTTWLDLEVSYAVALDRSESIPTMADPTVAGAVRKLNDLVRTGLATMAQPPE